MKTGKKSAYPTERGARGKTKIQQAKEVHRHTSNTYDIVAK